MAPWVAWVDYPVPIQSGRIKADLNLSLQGRQLSQLTGDVALTELKAQLGDGLKPLMLKKLSSDIAYKHGNSGLSTQLALDAFSWTDETGHMEAPANVFINTTLSGDQRDLTFRASRLDLGRLRHLAEALPIPGLRAARACRSGTIWVTRGRPQWQHSGPADWFGRRCRGSAAPGLPAPGLPTPTLAPHVVARFLLRQCAALDVFGHLADHRPVLGNAGFRIFDALQRFAGGAGNKAIQPADHLINGLQALGHVKGGGFGLCHRHCPQRGRAPHHRRFLPKKTHPPLRWPPGGFSPAFFTHPGCIWATPNILSLNSVRDTTSWPTSAASMASMVPMAFSQRHADAQYRQQAWRGIQRWAETRTSRSPRRRPASP